MVWFSVLRVRPHKRQLCDGCGVSEIHDAARRGFEQPDAYVRGRPGYPVAAVERLVAEAGIGPGRDVLELGAGTGAFTRELVGAGARVLALEPVEGMRGRLVEALPRVEIVGGQAERIELPAGCVDAVVVAQAFHWFDGERALPEIARVLRPAGRLGLIWNVRDESVDWVAALGHILDEHADDAPRYGSGAWRAAFEATTGFRPLQSASFPHVHRQTPDGVADRIGSVSYIAALPPDEHAAVRRQVAELLASHPQTRGLEHVDFPYRTDVHWCERGHRQL
jgi:SAM-dependent methyltransferase